MYIKCAVVSLHVYKCTERVQARHSTDTTAQRAADADRARDVPSTVLGEGGKYSQREYPSTTAMRAVRDDVLRLGLASGRASDIKLAVNGRAVTDYHQALAQMGAKGKINVVSVL